MDFSVRVNGTTYWTRTVSTPGWRDGAIDLSRWRGKTILLELVADSRSNYLFDWASWSNPQLSPSLGPCSYAVPAATPVTTAGGTFSLPVTAPTGCPWEAISAVSWLTPLSGAGLSNGAVSFAVLPNVGPDRTATLTIAGQTLTLTQPGVAYVTRYLAEGVTSPLFDTQLALLNPGPSDADAVIMLLRDGQLPLAHRLTVPARTRRTVRVKDDVAGLADAAFATAITATQALVVDRTMTWDGAGYGSHARRPWPTPATTWYLAEGATHGGFDLFYLLQNPAPTPTTVRVRYLRRAGAPLEKELRRCRRNRAPTSGSTSRSSRDWARPWPRPSSAR